MGNVAQGSFPAPKDIKADDTVKAPKPAAKSEDE